MRRKTQGCECRRRWGDRLETRGSAAAGADGGERGRREVARRIRGRHKGAACRVPRPARGVSVRGGEDEATLQRTRCAQRSPQWGLNQPLSDSRCGGCQPWGEPWKSAAEAAASAEAQEAAKSQDVASWMAVQGRYERAMCVLRLLTAGELAGI